MTKNFLNWVITISLLLRPSCVLSPFNHFLLFETPWTVAAKLFCPWDCPGKNIRVDAISFSRGIFPTQGSNPHLLYWQTGSLPLVPFGSKSIFTIESSKGQVLVSQWAQAGTSVPIEPPSERVTLSVVWGLVCFWFADPSWLTFNQLFLLRKS